MIINFALLFSCLKVSKIFSSFVFIEKNDVILDAVLIVNVMKQKISFTLKVMLHLIIVQIVIWSKCKYSCSSAYDNPHNLSKENLGFTKKEILKFLKKYFLIFRYKDQVGFVSHYLDFLIHLNDDNNTRVLFERVLSADTLPPKDAK